MATRRVTDDSAFELRIQLSQATHRKIRDLADDIVLTGEAPPVPGAPARHRRRGRPIDVHSGPA